MNIRSRKPKVSADLKLRQLMKTRELTLHYLKLMYDVGLYTPEEYKIKLEENKAPILLQPEENWYEDVVG